MKTVQEFKNLKTIGSRHILEHVWKISKKITSSQLQAHQQLSATYRRPVGDGKTANDLAIVKAGVWVHVTRWNFFQLPQVGWMRNAEPNSFVRFFPLFFLGAKTRAFLVGLMARYVEFPESIFVSI